MLSSDFFMDGWEARKDALRTSDSKSKKRILDDHHESVDLVKRIMAQLLDATQEPEAGP